MRFESILYFFLQVFNNLSLSLISGKVAFYVRHLIGNGINVRLDFHDDFRYCNVTYERDTGVYLDWEIGLCNEMILVSPSGRYVGPIPIQLWHLLRNVSRDYSFQDLSTPCYRHSSESGGLMLLEVLDDEVGRFYSDKATGVAYRLSHNFLSSGNT